MQNNIFTFDDPYDYKGIYIYPIKIKDFFIFSYAVECLLIDKNSIPDVSIISMSYLDFLINTSSDENKYREKLGLLLHLSLHVNPENIQIYKDEKNNVSLNFDGHTLTSQDFENIKKIILAQNLIDEPDYTIQKEIRDKIEEGKRIRNKTSKMADLEDQIVALSMIAGIEIEKIYEMTWRKFSKSIERADMLLHYKIYLSASMNGMVKFKNTSFIKHWLSEQESNSDNGFISTGDVTKKMNFEDRKK